MPTDAENYKTIAVIFGQVDVNKIGINWKAVANELGLNSVGGAKYRFQQILKLGNAPVPTGTKATGGAKRGPKPKKAAGVKRKASVLEGEDEGQAEDNDGSTYGVETDKGGRRKQVRDKGRKRAKVEAGDGEEFENGYVAECHYGEEYQQEDGQRLNGGSDVEDWLNYQVNPGPEVDDYAFQQYGQSFDDGYPQF
jgi:hypothetical protein